MNKEVILKNKKEFLKILASYQTSKHAQKVLSTVRYVVLIGPAAAGRNTIINELVKMGQYVQVVSDTTRPPKFRDGKMEEHGVNYYYRDEESLLSDLKNGEFLEAELIHGQQVSGTSIRELSRIVGEGKIGINEVEFGGAKNILLVKPDSVVVAVLPKSYQVWKQRFEKREVISAQEFKNRVQTAKKVLDFIKQDTRVKIVINDKYQSAAQKIDKIINGAEISQEDVRLNQKTFDEFEKNIDKLLKTL